MSFLPGMDLLPLAGGVIVRLAQANDAQPPEAAAISAGSAVPDSGIPSAPSDLAIVTPSSEGVQVEGSCKDHDTTSPTVAHGQATTINDCTMAGTVGPPLRPSMVPSTEPVSAHSSQSIGISPPSHLAVPSRNHQEGFATRYHVDNLPCLQIFQFLEEVFTKRDAESEIARNTSRRFEQYSQSSFRFPRMPQQRLEYILASAYEWSGIHLTHNRFQIHGFDISKFLAGALFKLSNTMTNAVSTQEDWRLHTIFFARLSPPIWSALARSQLPVVKLAMERLMIVTLNLDDSHAFQTMLLLNLHPMWTHPPTIIHKLAASNARECLTSFLSSLAPVEKVIEAVFKSSDRALRYGPKHTFSSLMVWLSKKLRSNDLSPSVLRYIQGLAHSESLIAGKPILVAALGHEADRLFPDSTLTNSIAAGLNDQQMIFRLMIDLGCCVSDLVVRKSLSVNPMDSTVAQLETLCGLRCVVEDDYDKMVFQFLGRVSEDIETCRAAFFGFALLLTSECRGSRYAFATLDGVTLMIHAVWHLKHFGSRPAIQACIEWLQHHGVTICHKVVAAAVSRNDTIDTLQQIQQLGADIKAYGGRALAVAASNIGDATVNWLLEQGLSVDAAVDNYGKTALSETGREQVNDSFWGVPLPSRYLHEYFTTPRLSAPEASFRLIDLGARAIANVAESPSSSFLSSLIGCSDDYSPSTWLPLLSRLDLRDKKASTFLERCVGREAWDLFDTTISRGAPPTPDVLGYALHEKAPETLINGLLSAGVRVNIDLEEGLDPEDYWHPAEEGCRSWNMSIIKQFEAQDGDLHGKFGHNNSLLKAACEERPATPIERRNRNFLVRYFIERGADVDATSLHGRRALYEAASNGDLELAMLLLDNGARCDMVARQPWRSNPESVLDVAVHMQRLDTVQLLLNVGARSAVPGLTGFDGAIQYALTNGNEHIRQLLERFAATEGAD
ncbi:uncharacterized protein B0I36DRAFT_355372 [Microdochium trichocladiopsis]|uniref:Ankyrin repeat-containing domain protein n=1 Tax=Microdochium trichocladiopsis TaxID=1682393 RepID=A0A9P8XRF7_9PEZI|nr:uncharacterized protein B0I36DRAFT_355372 [Microdochium trichocladiopsis]KAH7014105.1 hypothetical protein B0I36DRAFT_355372 [Microdochium trichocladiopsis]